MNGNSEKVRILSDYTPLDEPNILEIIRDEQGDVSIRLHEESMEEMGIRIAMEGSRHSQKVGDAFHHLLSVYREELKTNKNQDVKEINEIGG